jgi:hypothetical protein
MGAQGGPSGGPSSADVFPEERLGVTAAKVLSVYGLLLASLVLVHALGTDGEHFIRSLVCIAPAAVLSLIGLWVLVQAYWELVRSDPDTIDVVLVVALFAFPVMLMTLETFAGLTTLLWDRGLLSSTSALHPNLLTMEKLYAWHVMDAFPVLDITKTLGWNAPIAFSDHWSGVLLLMFKVVLLVPLLGVLTASYQIFQDRRIQRLEVPKTEDSDSTEGEHPSFLLIVGESTAALARYLISWLWQMRYPIVAYVAILFLVSGSSPLNRWLVSTLGTGYVSTAMHILGVAVVLVLTVRAVFFSIPPIETGIVSMGGDVLFSVSSVMRRTRGLIMATLLACTITVVFLPAGVSHAVPMLQAGDEVPATVAWYSWHLADAIPFVEAPQSLNWSLNSEFVDSLSRVLLLLLKIYLVFLLFRPIKFLFELYKRMGIKTPEPSEGSGSGSDQRK